MIFKNRIHSRTAAVASMSLLLAGCVAKSTYLKSQDRATGLDTQVSQLTKQNQDLTQQLNDVQQRLNQTQQSAEELSKQKSEQDQMLSSLQDQVQAGQIKITQLAGKLSINMVDKILFDSGSARLKPEGEQVLMKVGEALKNLQGKRIWVGGHTDNMRISPSLMEKFPTNWELSTARATSVVRFLQDKSGISGDRLIASGYGEFQPVADNKTAEGREQNRRIELLLVPDQDTQGAAAAAPVVAPPPAVDTSTTSTPAM